MICPGLRENIKSLALQQQPAKRRTRFFIIERCEKKIKSQIQKGDFESPFPIDNEVSNPWTWDKDGKQYWPDATDKDLGK